MDILSSDRLLILAESAEPHAQGQEEKKIHDALWAQFLPYLIVALAVYTLLAICWILWNIYTYRRDLANAKKGKAVSRLYEKWRLLSIYDQVPLPSSSSNNTANNGHQISRSARPTTTAAAMAKTVDNGHQPLLQIRPHNHDGGHGHNRNGLLGHMWEGEE